MRVLLNSMSQHKLCSDLIILFVTLFTYAPTTLINVRENPGQSKVRCIFFFEIQTNIKNLGCLHSTGYLKLHKFHETSFQFMNNYYINGG